MFLVAFISVLLSVFEVSVANSGYNDSLERIFLIENMNELNKNFSDIFETACGKYYRIERGPIEIYEQYKDSNVAVIYFAAPNNIIKDNFVYAGSVSHPNKVNCTKTDNKINCNDTTANLVNVHLTQFDDGSLFEYVQSFQLDTNYSLTEKSCRPHFKSITNLNTVIICHNFMTDFKMYEYLKQRYYNMLNLIEISDSSCDETIEDNQYRLLAILRPKPKKDTLVPTVLLRTPHISSENRIGLPNSMNLVPWQLLKFGIVKFIQNVGWQRVIVLSDDSEYSVDFEKELTDLLQKERIVYTSAQCDGAECSLETLIKKMKKLLPRIVIANMEKGYRLYKLITTFSHRVTWILRDMEDTDMTELNNQMTQKRNIFSVSLRSYNQHTDDNCDTSMNNDVITGIETIANAYTNINRFADSMKKKEFYRLFAEKMNEMTRNEAIVCVNRISQNNNRLVSTMYVNASGVEVRSFKQPFKKVPADVPFCLAYSYKYLKPCDNVQPLLYMFVVLLFVLTVLWLTCFFDKSTPLNRNNYYRQFT